jgi:hypothetical protein
MVAGLCNQLFFPVNKFPVPCNHPNLQAAVENENLASKDIAYDLPMGRLARAGKEVS